MSFRPVQSPVCPVLLDCGDILDNTNMDAIVRSIHAIHEAGQLLFSGAGLKTNLNFPAVSQLMPLVGYYGASVGFISVLSQKFPIEIYPGMDQFSLITSQKLYFSGQNMTIYYYIENGSTTYLLANYSGSLIGSAQNTQALTGTLPSGIVPQIGQSVAGNLRIDVQMSSQFTHNGSASNYFGCVAATLKQFKNC